MKYKTLIWDFNGTLLDDTKISISAINTVLERRGMKTIDSFDAFQEIFCFPVSEYYRRLGFDFEKEPYKIPADEWVKLYSASMFDAPLNEGVRDILAYARNMGLRQIVFSASERSRLTEHIKRLGISEFFDDIIGTDDVYAKGKIDLAKDFAKKNPHIFPALFIGDTDHDHLCALEMGCDCVLYSGGFMSKKRLAVLGSPVISSMSDLAEYFSETKNS